MDKNKKRKGKTSHPWREYDNDTIVRAQYIGESNEILTTNVTYEIRVFGTYQFPIAVKLVEGEGKVFGYIRVQKFLQSWTNIENISK